MPASESFIKVESFLDMAMSLQSWAKAVKLSLLLCRLPTMLHCADLASGLRQVRRETSCMLHSWVLLHDLEALCTFAWSILRLELGSMLAWICPRIWHTWYMGLFTVMTGAPAAPSSRPCLPYALASIRSINCLHVTLIKCGSVSVESARVGEASWLPADSVACLEIMLQEIVAL